MKQAALYRWGFYLLGLLILAMGLTLNTKAGLGVSAIISVSSSISEVFGYSFGNTTLGLYSVFIVIGIILHIIRDRRYEKNTAEALKNAGRRNRKLVLLMDLLQLPLSIVFTRFLNLFSAGIPDLSSGGRSTPGWMAVRVIVLLTAIVFTGIGAAMSLNMRIIPNPGDGIVQAISDLSGKETGLVKNIFDGFNVALSIILGLSFAGGIVGIGIGTIIAFLGVGRFVAIFNRFCFPFIRSVVADS